MTRAAAGKAALGCGELAPERSRHDRIESGIDLALRNGVADCRSAGLYGPPATGSRPIRRNAFCPMMVEQSGFQPESE
jgi:hypothetical protein